MRILDRFSTFLPLFLCENIREYIIFKKMSNSLILRSLWPSVTKIQPGKESITDRQTDGHPESIDPNLWGWGLIICLTTLKTVGRTRLQLNQRLQPQEIDHKCVGRWYLAILTIENSISYEVTPLIGTQTTTTSRVLEEDFVITFYRSQIIRIFRNIDITLPINADIMVHIYMYYYLKLSRIHINSNLVRKVNLYFCLQIAAMH